MRQWQRPWSGHDDFKPRRSGNLQNPIDDAHFQELARKNYRSAKRFRSLTRNAYGDVIDAAEALRTESPGSMRHKRWRCRSTGST